MKYLATTVLALIVSAFIWVQVAPDSGGTYNPPDSGVGLLHVGEATTDRDFSSQPAELVGVLPADTLTRTPSESVAAEPSSGADVRETSEGRKPPRGLSGLTHDEKIEQVLIAYRDFQSSLEKGGRQQVLAEDILATRCAIAVMRESGRADYNVDIDDGEKRAFRVPSPTPGVVFVAADNAKYLIDLNEFGALRLARERGALIGRGSQANALPDLTPAEMAVYEKTVDQAYSALGIERK